MLIKTKRTNRPTLEKVITPTALILIDGDVVKNYLNADVVFSRQSAADNIEAIWPFVKHGEFFHLVVPNASTQITLEVGEVGDERFEAKKKAEAIVIKTLGHRILSKAFVRARKHKYPVRAFEKEQDAIDWFNSLRLAEG